MEYTTRTAAMLVLLMAACLSPEQTSAALYTYQGNPFDSISGSPPPDGVHAVSGTFEVAGFLAPNLPLGTIVPLAWSFTDGLTTITSETTGFTAAEFQIKTNSSGQIIEWMIAIDGTAFPTLGLLGLATQFDTLVDLAGLGIDLSIYCLAISGPTCSDSAVGSVSDQPGVWAVSPVPLPAAAWLLVSGVAVIGALRRRIRGD